MNKLNDYLLFLCIGVLGMFFASGACAVTSEVTPDRISVNSLYHGSTVVVTGEVDAGEDIIVKFSSPEKKAHLRKKGKTGGLLWMNVGELEFDPVSDVYLVYSTKNIDSILSPDQQDRYVLGYDAIKRLVEVSPVTDEAEKEKWVDEFLKFKEKNRTYGIFEGDIQTDTKNNRKTFTVTVDLPYQAPPQEYMVTVYGVKNNSVQDRKETPLPVKTVGALNFISTMAFQNAPMYGIVSILIAIAAGFIVSVIFKGGGGGH
jgi:uncharacterized protein (TIGR02186 family)